MKSLVRIAFTGDVFVGDHSVSAGPRLQNLLGMADISVVNLECPLTNEGDPLPGKAANLRNNPRTIELFKQLSIDLACLANNHICDWGRRGFENTLKILDKHNIAYVGAGLNKKKASEPVIVSRNNVRIAFAAFGSLDIGTVAASDTDYGCMPFIVDEACHIVCDLRDRSDIIVAMVHTGSTNYHYPLPEDVHAVRQLVDAGADLIVGHHPHVIQGGWHYGEKGVFYSLGNLCFSTYMRKGRITSLSAENRKGMVLLATVDCQGLQETSIYHTRQTDNKGNVELLDDSGQRRRQRIYKRLSEPLINPDDYEQFFRRYVLRRTCIRLLGWLNPLRWRYLTGGHLAGFIASLKRLRG